MGMNFREALNAMRKGYKVELPNWAGYWAWENDEIIMHTKEGTAIRLLDTQRPKYTFDNIRHLMNL